MAVLAACERMIHDWPVEARIAFRDAVQRDVTQFVADDWNVVSAMVRAEIFLDRWERGLPWPPDPNELLVPPVPRPEIDREAIEALANRIRALGVELARASR
jgi:hypothetical protein